MMSSEINKIQATKKYTEMSNSIRDINVRYQFQSTQSLPVMHYIKHRKKVIAA